MVCGQRLADVILVRIPPTPLMYTSYTSEQFLVLFVNSKGPSRQFSKTADIYKIRNFVVQTCLWLMAVVVLL